MLRKLLVFCLPFFIAFWTGCGSGSSGNRSAGGGNVSAPVPVTVAAGADSSADITVVSPASNPTPNAVALGVGGNSAFSTGDFIHLNSSPTVLIFGQGISANMNITISGPGDIQVSNLTTIKAQDNTPGVSFTATVPGNAALGARTVMLKDANNDITTFTGSLEVVP